MNVWYAVEARVRAEDTVSKLLQAKGYSYVFCQRLPILTTPGVRKIVGFGKNIIALDESEIESVHRTVASKRDARPCPMRTYLGQAVEVVEGPLRGVRGVVLKVNNKDTLMVAITLLQRAIRMDLEYGRGYSDKGLLERANRHGAC